MRKLLRKPVTWIVAAVLVVALGVGAWLFQPWLLFVDSTVDEQLPQSQPTSEAGDGDGGTADERESGPVDLAAGDFVSQEHDTSGAARLVRQQDGSHVLAIEGLDTSNGPDLRVWLTDQGVDGDEWFVYDDGYHVELGELKGNKGDQVYEVPEDVELDKVTSVSVWCVRFSVSFGAAPLIQE